jgi:hypothetical protein
MKWRGFSSVAVVAMLVATAVLGGTASAATLKLERVDGRITIVSPGTCDVQLAIVIDGDRPQTVEHRLTLVGGMQIAALSVTGGGTLGESKTVGVTLSVPVTLLSGGSSAYTVRYRVRQSQESDGRCPILVPLVATNGLDRVVTLTAQLPDGSEPLDDTFPAFSWSGPTTGSVRIGHVPAFVLLPFVRQGENTRWQSAMSRRRVVDAMALATLVVASLLWYKVKGR